MKLTDAFALYREDMHLRTDLAPRTLEGYRTCASRFVTALGPQATTDDLTGATLLRYQTQLFEREAAPRTVRCHMASLRDFCRWCYERGYTAANAGPTVKLPKPVDDATRLIPTPGEVAELLQGCGRMHPKRRGDMARALVHCFAYAGLRRHEALSLTLSDVDEAESCLRVRHIRYLNSKRESAERSVFVSAETMQAIRRWLNVRGEMEHTYLFANSLTEPLGVPALTSIMQDALYASGLRYARHITPVSLRSFYADRMARHGADLQFIHRQLGNRDMHTTRQLLRSSTAYSQQIAQRFGPEAGEPQSGTDTPAACVPAAKPAPAPSRYTFTTSTGVL